MITVLFGQAGVGWVDSPELEREVEPATVGTGPGPGVTRPGGLPRAGRVAGARASLVRVG